MRIRNVLIGAFVAPTITLAQNTPGAMSRDMHKVESQAAFRVGPTSGTTIGAPRVDLSGGYFHAPEKDGLAKLQTGFVTLRAQAGLGTEHVQLAANAIFVPKLGGNPELTTMLQVVPTDQDRPLHFSVGAGMVAGAFGSPSRADVWVESVLALRTPIHVISPFVQVGLPLRDGARAQIMIGAAHPLMPYKFHLTR